MKKRVAQAGYGETKVIGGCELRKDLLGEIQSYVRALDRGVAKRGINRPAESPGVDLQSDIARKIGFGCGGAEKSQQFLRIGFDKLAVEVMGGFFKQCDLSAGVEE